MNVKLTTSQIAILHLIWSGIVGLLISVGSATWQYNATHGFNLVQDGSYFLICLLTGAGSAYASILHNVQSSPSAPQAAKDTEQDAKAVGESMVAPVIQWLNSNFTRLEDTLKDHVTQTVQEAQKKPVQVVFPAMSSPTSPLPANAEQVITSTSTVLPPAVVPTNATLKQ